MHFSTLRPEAMMALGFFEEHSKAAQSNFECQPTARGFYAWPKGWNVPNLEIWFLSGCPFFQ
jgi:hypothetical protein